MCNGRLASSCGAGKNKKLGKSRLGKNTHMKRTRDGQTRVVAESRNVLSFLSDYVSDRYDTCLDEYASKRNIGLGLNFILRQITQTSYGGFTLFYLCLSLGSYLGCQSSSWYVEGDEETVYRLWNTFTLYDLYLKKTVLNRRKQVLPNYMSMYHRLSKELLVAEKEVGDDGVSSRIFSCDPIPRHSQSVSNKGRESAIVEMLIPSSFLPLPARSVSMGSLFEEEGLDMEADLY